MDKLIFKQFRRELFYAIFLFVILQFSIIPMHFELGVYSLWFKLLGTIMMLSWIFTTYRNYSGRKVSEQSDVLIKIQLKNRFFTFFITPLLLYLSVAFYIYFIRNELLKQFIISTSFVLMLFLFIHIRSSYEKVFSVAKSTRSIFLFIDLMLFYIATTGFVLMGTDSFLRVLGTTALAFIFLVNILAINKQYSYKALLVLLASLLFFFTSSLYFVRYGALLFPLYMVVVFYIIVNIWEIKLSGENSISEYLPPLLFGLMAFMILLSF